MDHSLITDAVRAMVGASTPPRLVTVTAETVRRVREALADGPVLDSDDVPAAVLAVLESEQALPLPEGLPESSLVTGDEWEWRRPLRLGETLSVTARLADANERFGGRLGHSLFLRHESVFAGADGEPAAYARRSIAYYDGAGVRPSDDLPPEDAPLPELSPLPQGVDPRSAAEGEPITPRVVTPTLSQVVRFCGATWSFVPIFYDPDAARAVGLPGTIIPGPLKLSLVAETVRAWVEPHGSLVSVRAAHRRPDTPGRLLRLCGVVSGVEHRPAGRRLSCDLWIENALGERSTVGAAVVQMASLVERT